MVEKANVIIETFADGTLESLGLAFPQLQAIKRRIIVVSLPDGADEASSHFAALNAFAAASLAAFNADSHEIPQHIRISAGECLAAVGGFPAGDVPARRAAVHQLDGRVGAGRGPGASGSTTPRYSASWACPAKSWPGCAKRARCDRGHNAARRPHDPPLRAG